MRLSMDVEDLRGVVDRLTGVCIDGDAATELSVESGSREEMLAFLVLDFGLLDQFPTAKRTFDLIVATMSRRETSDRGQIDPAPIARDPAAIIALAKRIDLFKEEPSSANVLTQLALMSDERIKRRSALRLP
jgi:hypothetical protein